MHKIILDEQASKTLDELEKIIYQMKNIPTEQKSVSKSVSRILNQLNRLSEKTIALVYRICFELLPGSPP